MASISTTRGTKKRRVKFIGTDRRPRTIHLGKVPMTTTEEVKGKVESILAAVLHKVSPDAETAAWLGEIDDAL